MNARSINNFTNSRGRRGVISVNNTIFQSLWIVGRAIKYITVTTDRHPRNAVASGETSHTNPVRARENNLPLRSPIYPRRERDVPKDPWESRYYGRSSLRSRPGARLGYFRDSAYGPK